MDPAGTDAARYAPPQAVVQDLAPADGTPVLAGRGMRFLAAMVDLVVMMAAMWLLSKVTPWNPFDPATQASLGSLALNSLLGAAVFIAIQGVPLVRRGQTVGKMVAGMRIVRPDGSLASPGRVVGLRYLLPYVLSPFPMIMALYGLVDALAIFGKPRRCIHDLIAGTIVVKA